MGGRSPRALWRFGWCRGFGPKLARNVPRDGIECVIPVTEESRGWGGGLQVPNRCGRSPVGMRRELGPEACGGRHAVALEWQGWGIHYIYLPGGASSGLSVSPAYSPFHSSPIPPSFFLRCTANPRRELRVSRVTRTAPVLISDGSGCDRLLQTGQTRSRTSLRERRPSGVHTRVW
jgi:hypothetical protein